MVIVPDVVAQNPSGAGAETVSLIGSFPTGLCLVHSYQNPPAIYTHVFHDVTINNFLRKLLYP